jgi:hypothetical protein|tara:strand:+ start:308 stop:538 length:231 start_codon:yes stop_codon:yes gene_type:complete
MVKQVEKDCIKDLLVCSHTTNALFCEACRYDASTYKYDTNEMLALKGVKVDPDTFCNPIEWLDKAEVGLKKWVDEQ